MRDALIDDIRLAWRRLRKSPSFTLVAILTLALGSGANTAIFTLLHALIFRDLAVRNPGELVQLSMVMRNGQEAGLSFPAFRQIERDSQDMFSALIAWTGGMLLPAEINGEPSPANVWMVTGNFHSELGAIPALGRLLSPADANLETVSGASVAVLGYDFWQRRFGGDSAVVGRAVTVAGVPFTIVGVSPRGFRGLSRTAESDITVPITAQQLIFGEEMVQWHRGNVFWVNLVVRGRPAVSVEEIRAKLTAMWPNVLAATMPADFSGVRRDNFLAIRLVVDTVTAPAERMLRRQFRRPLLVVMGIALFVLVIACVNLATLMLARVIRRRHEIGVQLALGASRWRVARQVLAEGVIVSVVGAACGLMPAAPASRAVAAMLLPSPLNLPASLNTTPDVQILSLTASLGIGTGLLFAAIPAWLASRREPLVLFRDGGRTVSSSGRLGQWLVASQVALCLVLVIDAGLLVRSLGQLRGMSPGFVADGVIAASLTPRTRSPRDSRNDGTYVSRLITETTSQPGVQDAAASAFIPGAGFSLIEFVSAVPPSPGEEIAAAFAAVSPGFFRLLRIPLRQGRDFNWNDGQGAQSVTIISRALARRIFGDRDPVGQFIRIGVFPHRQRLQVIGVVGDVRLYDIKDPNVYAAFMPQAQDRPGYARTLLVRGAVSVRDLARVVASFGHEHVLTAESLENNRDRALLVQRVTAILAAFLGALALLLAAIGVYGLMSYQVGERTREFGIRFALGATPRRVIGTVLARGAGTAALGLALGFVAAWISVRLVRSLLFGVTEHDTVTLGSATVLLAAVVTLACVVPATRAARVDVVDVLRSE
jgi:predicted permease